MTIYADSACVLNGLIDYALLVCGARLGGAAIRRRRLALAAAFGGIYGAAALYPALSVLRLPWMKAASFAAIVLLAYGAGRRTLRTGLLFLACACAFAGLSLACAQLCGMQVLLLPGGAYYPVRFVGLVLLAALAYLACYTVFACTAQHGGEIRMRRLTLGGRSAEIRVLHDTGCTLCDPVTGERALVAEFTVLQQLLPQADITADALRDPAALLVRLHTQDPALSVRLLHYRAVGTQAGLLLALRCGLQGFRGQETSCLAAFSPTPVSDGGGFNALTGGDI